MTLDNFINIIIKKQRNDGYNILKKLPNDLQIIIWKIIFQSSLNNIKLHKKKQ